ncbi:MAG: hypothetical protein M1830_008973 [Pleopsidium flavum]|nr:MAG: hypothetical protein M1830_008973 [Pleopsidium flavum]
MTTLAATNDIPLHETRGQDQESRKEKEVRQRKWRTLFGSENKGRDNSATSVDDFEDDKIRPEKWSFGVLNDKVTDEVPGSVLLLSSTNRNEPLGLRDQPARTSASSIPSPYPAQSRRESRRLATEEKKKTADGQIVLDPQPDDSLNDPLNWPAWRRDTSLLSLGFYCMVGGGMTPILAAGFSNVASTYDVSIPKVALTTGLYMMGLGLGSVIASPTAILFGKRPVYLVGIMLFLISAVWCALSPNYTSLVIARIFMGIAVSPCECLPSATIAEVFFLHERAYRVGIYTLLLLGGKNLIPLVSAVIIQSLGWRWVFWIVAIVVGFCFILLFLFVPETFWDRTPRPKSRTPTPASSRTLSSVFTHALRPKTGPAPFGDGAGDMRKFALANSAAAAGAGPGTIAERRQQKNGHHVGFAPDPQIEQSANPAIADVRPLTLSSLDHHGTTAAPINASSGVMTPHPPGHYESPPLQETHSFQSGLSLAVHEEAWRVVPNGDAPKTPGLHSFNSPFYLAVEEKNTDYLKNEHQDLETAQPVEKSLTEDTKSPAETPKPLVRYTTFLKTQPPKTFAQTLRPWNGRLRNDRWLHVAFRPFILFAYPSVLWSTMVYSLSVGWLIVLSESVSTVYRSKETYNFSALGTGLIYLSPFIGGVLGTAVAGKVSDIIVRFMSRRNGGLYEPEFRLVMAIPVAIATSIGLMGFGWSAAERDRWIVPTVFFGIISFGCSLGSTTAITFCVDSYRQYAGEALVTLNFSKNIFHGLVFSLFFNRWLEADGSKKVFLALGGIQLACLLLTIPMYIYGKRCRMWTVRKNLMEKF